MTNKDDNNVCRLQNDDGVISGNKLVDNTSSYMLKAISYSKHETIKNSFTYFTSNKLHYDIDI